MVQTLRPLALCAGMTVGQVGTRQNIPFGGHSHGMRREQFAGGLSLQSLSNLLVCTAHQLAITLMISGGVAARTINRLESLELTVQSLRSNPDCDSLSLRRKKATAGVPGSLTPLCVTFEPKVASSVAVPVMLERDPPERESVASTAEPKLQLRPQQPPPLPVTPPPGKYEVEYNPAPG